MSRASDILNKMNLDEVLDPREGAYSYIHDFVASKDKRFRKDPKKQRIYRALGAYYAAAKKAGIDPRKKRSTWLTPQDVHGPGFHYKRKKKRRQEED